MHVVRILVGGIGQHAGDGDANESAAFREAVKEFTVALETGISSADLLVRAGSVLSGLDEHKRRHLRQQHLQMTELKNMVKMLTATVGGISVGSNTNVSMLSEIEKQVADVSELDNVRVIKSRLSDCLGEIRKEAERQKREAEETVERLSHELEQARRLSAEFQAAEKQDVLTGLPLRREAEAALAEPGPAGYHAYATVIVLDRLQLLNRRFGREVGDEILLAFIRKLQKSLKAEDRLYRWGGPALVALLHRPNNLDHVRGEVSHAIEEKMEHSIQSASRSVLIPVTTRWTLFPVTGATRLLCQQIDSFADFATATPPAPRD